MREKPLWIQVKGIHHLKLQHLRIKVLKRSFEFSSESSEYQEVKTTCFHLFSVDPHAELEMTSSEGVTPHPLSLLS